MDVNFPISRCVLTMGRCSAARVWPSVLGTPRLGIAMVIAPPETLVVLTTALMDQSVSQKGKSVCLPQRSVLSTAVVGIMLW